MDGDIHTYIVPDTGIEGWQERDMKEKDKNSL